MFKLPLKFIFDEIIVASQKSFKFTNWYILSPLFRTGILILDLIQSNNKLKIPNLPPPIIVLGLTIAIL